MRPLVRIPIRLRSSRHPRLIATAVLAAVIGAGLGGCGEKVEPGQQATLTITSGFGEKVIVGPKSTPVTAGLTAMRQLQPAAKVETAYAGKFVDSINGLKGSGSAGNDWLFYVDGTQSDTGAASWRVKAGEQIQWDYHQWRDITAPEAIVGAYPRPLVNDGVKLVCMPSGSAACARVKKQFPKPGSVTVVVGEWDDIAGVQGVPDLTQPALDNGAFASFTGKPGSRELELLATDGKIAVTNGAGAGLVAASRVGKAITWVVTGTDEAGVRGASLLLEQAVLRNKFVISWQGARGAISLPVPAGGGAQ
jgi:hypothetical protein